MQVSLEYELQCKCGETFYGSKFDEAYKALKEHRKRDNCKEFIHDTDFYLVDEKGEPVEGLYEVLDRLLLDGMIEYPEP